MSENRKERKQLAKAILELHDLYISTGESEKPMTISLPDIAEMAGLPEKETEEALIQFMDEKLISVAKSAIYILENKKLTKLAHD